MSRVELENKLDALWRSVGKGSATCSICATLPPSERVLYRQLHPHHIIKRGHKATRWDLRNRIWVCPTHHRLGKTTCEYNEGGWFWSSGDCWLGTYRPADREYLEAKKHETKRWTLEELEILVEGLTYEKKRHESQTENL